jgi:hypothetical protein
MRTIREGFADFKKSTEGALLISNLIRHQLHLCYICRKPINGNYHIDHLIPLSLLNHKQVGLSTSPDNLYLACPSCNLSKGTKLSGWYLIRCFTITYSNYSEDITSTWINTIRELFKGVFRHIPLNRAWLKIMDKKSSITKTEARTILKGILGGEYKYIHFQVFYVET